MTVIRGSFAATDRTRDPEEQFAEIRQEVVDSLYRTLDSTKHGWLFPGFLIEAVKNEVWKHPRKLTHNTLPAMPLADFVKRSYPTGLGSSFDVIEKLIAGNECAMLAWDKAVRGEHGGAREGAGRKPAVAADVPAHDPDTGEINVSNIHVEKTPDRPAGTTAQAGLRRLDNAARAGDNNAADLLRRVIDPHDTMTVNGACVAMGWRKPTLTVVNTPDGLAAAAARVMGPLETVRRAWARSTQEQREEIAAWVDEQMSPLARSAFR
jgi:hypothetical protein